MTSPGGLGEAYVSLVADSSDFDEQLGKQLRKIAKERGPEFGEQFSKGMVAGFRKQLKADLGKFEALGNQAGTAVRRGFNGEAVGDRIGQDILRGMRKRLKNANIQIGGVTAAVATGTSASTSTGGTSGRQPLGTDSERAEDRLRKQLQKRLAEFRAAEAAKAKIAEATRKALERTQAQETAAADREAKQRERIRVREQNAATREVEKGLREAERAQKAETAAADREGKARERLRVREQNAATKAFEKGVRDTARERDRQEREIDARARRRRSALSQLGSLAPSPSGAIDKGLRSVTALGPGGGFGVKGLVAVGGAAAALTPQIGSLFQALRNMGGALFGLLPALTGVGALMAIFRGENVQTEKALKPVADALDRVRLNLDGIFAAASQGGLRDFASEVEKIQPGLEAFANSLGNAFSNVLGSLTEAGAGDSLSRAFASIGSAVEALTSGPGLTGFLRLLLQINEQVAARLPEAFTRLQGFLNGLGERFSGVDFGAVFDRGIQAVVDFGASVINLLRVFNAFFSAVSGNREQGTFFASLREGLANLVVTIQANGPAITAFFDRVRALATIAVAVIKGVFAILSSFATGVGTALGASGNSVSGLVGTIQQLVAVLVPFAFQVGEVVGQIAGLILQFIQFLQANDLLLPALVTLATAFAGIQLGLFIAGLAGTVAAIVALGAPVLGAIALFAGLAGAIVYMNTSTSALADVMRGIFNAALAAIQFPMNVLLGTFRTMLAVIRDTAGALSNLPGGEIFNGIILGASKAIAYLDAVGVAARAAFNIQGPSPKTPRGVTSDDRRDSAAARRNAGTTDERRDASAARRGTTVGRSAEQQATKDTNDIIDRIKGAFPSTGVRSTGGGGGGAGRGAGAGGGGAAAAAPRAVDLEALLERLSDSLKSALPQGAEATADSFVALGRAIRDTLKGTAQEGRTGSAQAALERTRKSAIAAAASYEQITAAVEATKQRLTELKDEQESFRKSVFDTLKAAGTISSFLSNRKSGSAASFGNFLQRQVALLERFSTSLQALLTKGLDPVLVRELAAGGLDNERIARRLADATPEQVQRINDLQKRINTLSATTADKTAATFDAGIKRVESLLSMQLIQQKRQEAALNLLAQNIVKGIAAAIQGKPLPKFARGGITSGPSLAGEAGRELIVPLDRPNRRADALLERTIGGRGGDKYVSAGFTINAAPGQSPASIAAEVDRRLAAAVR